MQNATLECPVRATAREGSRIRFSVHWMMARRCSLRLTEDELICGDWRIPYDEFEDAVLVDIPTRVGTGRTLMVTWRGVVHQFSLRPISAWRMVYHPFWDGPLPFSVRREVFAPRRGRWSIVLDLAVVALLVWILARLVS